MWPGTDRLPLGSLALLACGWSFAGAAIAQTWEGEISVQPGLVYTDNVCLSKNNKRSDWTGVATIAPVGSIEVETSKTTASLGGDLKVNALTNGDLRDNGCTGDSLDDRQQWYPGIFGSLNTELVGDWVKFDAQARADQNSIDSTRASSNDGLNRNGNNNTYYRYLLSPYTSRPVTGTTDFNARYAFSQVINTADEVNNSDRHTFNTSLNGEAGPRVTWNVGGQYSLTSYEGDFINRATGVVTPREDTELRSLSLRTAYQISRSWEVDGTYGQEWNDFQTSGAVEKDGSAWDLGVKWTPSSRTTVSVGSGDRFFGKTPRVAFSHTGRRTEISGTYNKRITFQRDLTTLGLGTDGISSFDASDSVNNIGVLPETGFDNNGDPLIGLGTDSSISSNSAIFDERATLIFAYEGRPGRLTLFGSYSQQTRAEDGAQADFTDWEVTWRPNFSRKYSVLAAIGYQDIVPGSFSSGGIDFDENALKSEDWYYRLIYVRSINKRLGTNLEYRFTDRRSDAQDNEYQENMVIATLNISL